MVSRFVGIVLIVSQKVSLSHLPHLPGGARQKRLRQLRSWPAAHAVTNYVEITTANNIVLGRFIAREYLKFLSTERTCRLIARPPI